MNEAYKTYLTTKFGANDKRLPPALVNRNTTMILILVAMFGVVIVGILVTLVYLNITKGKTAPPEVSIKEVKESGGESAEKIQVHITE